MLVFDQTQRASMFEVLGHAFLERACSKKEIQTVFLERKSRQDSPALDFPDFSGSYPV
jgi:hypothetical protein